MKVTEYIKTIRPLLICQLILLLILDAILLASSNLLKSLPDILYLNILVVLILFVYFIYDFIRMKNRYGRLNRALEDEVDGDVDTLMPEDDSFYSSLLRKAVRRSYLEHRKITDVHENNMDELNNYITKWVHEIKIPISVLELMLENTEDLDTENARKFKTEIQRIKFLANQVLYAGRAAQYQEDVNVCEFSLNNAVREALKLNAYFLMTKNIEVNADRLNHAVVNDEKWVIYILEQLLNNAGKYVRQDGRIEIFAAEDDTAVKLHVKDNGIGIPAADLPRIYDKGFTGENGRKTSKSTGMGLYYSKKMADRLGIGLEVSSEAGKYTEFILVFYKLSDYLNVTKM